MWAGFCVSPRGLGLQCLQISQGRFGGFLPPGQMLPLSVVKEKPGSEVPEHVRKPWPNAGRTGRADLGHSEPGCLPAWML